MDNDMQSVAMQSLIALPKLDTKHVVYCLALFDSQLCIYIYKCLYMFNPLNCFDHYQI